MSATSGTSNVTPSIKAVARTATPADFEGMLDAGVAAFIHDPLMLYFGNVQLLEGAGLSVQDTKGLRAFISFLHNSCRSRGGRINVTVVPQEAGKEKIVSAAFWFPPKKRIEQHQILQIYRDGGTAVIKNWGIGCLSRTGSQYSDPAHRIFEKSFKSRGVTRSPDDTWYFAYAFTHPDFQGHGCMSLLVREQFAYDPAATYVTEGNSEKTRSQYAHLGFEPLETFVIGKGSIGSDGLPASGKEAVGSALYPMVKWGKQDFQVIEKSLVTNESESS